MAGRAAKSYIGHTRFDVLVGSGLHNGDRNETVGLAGGGSSFAGLGEFAVFANHADERLRGAREAAVAAVDEAEFAPEIHAFDGEELHFPAFTWSLAKLSLIKETPASAATKRLIMPILGNSMVT